MDGEAMPANIYNSFESTSSMDICSSPSLRPGLDGHRVISGSSNSSVSYDADVSSEIEEVEIAPPVLHSMTKCSRTENKSRQARGPRLVPRQELERQRDDQNRLLIYLRGKGLTYQECREIGGFKEEVSTLRGRMRAIRDPQAARSRKPAWTFSDVSKDCTCDGSS